MQDVFKGVRLRNDSSQSQLTEAFKYATSAVKTQESTENYRKYLKLLSTDHYTKYMMMRATFLSVKQELQQLKARDSDRTTLFDDFVRTLDKGLFKEISWDNDYYPSIDIEQLAEKVESMQKRFKYLLTMFFLEM